MTLAFESVVTSLNRGFGLTPPQRGPAGQTFKYSLAMSILEEKQWLMKQNGAPTVAQDIAQCNTLKEQVCSAVAATNTSLE